MFDAKIRNHLTTLFKAQLSTEQTDCSIGYLSDMLLKVSARRITGSSPESHVKVHKAYLQKSVIVTLKRK